MAEGDGRVTSTWEQRMAAAAEQRATVAAERRAAEDARAEMRDEERHADHHMHRVLYGNECSCGRRAGVTCYVINEEVYAWWAAQSCELCGAKGVVLERA